MNQGACHDRNDKQTAANGPFAGSTRRELSFEMSFSTSTVNLSSS